ncbi:MAG: gliding motility-associated C-terminal domain-containing protein [Elusimicrobia bacterium]|nr:gliding motility-associated C-terminal domain-containing protein [Elusimicrobiota bacterium]
MPRSIWLLSLLALSTAPGLRAEPRLSGGAVAVARNSVARGGGLSAGGGLILDSSIAENAVSTASGAGFVTSPGLMSIIAQPGSVTGIAAVSKDTGTLTLSWVAPGLDGFEGDVASGFWRIDSSSDPLHVFDPTVFTTEFATAVTPGATQSYTLTGLLANTTYYSRVYLADARKVASETSAPSAESSLARVPAAPVFSGVFATSVTISWTLPAGGAEGFRLDASSTSFLGGVIVSSRTPSGAVVTLTVAGLQPATTYFFNLGSLNWQSDLDFSTVMTTRTIPGGVTPILDLALTADNGARRVTLTWSNPAFDDPAGVTILVSTNPISSALVDGVPYPLGTTLADGAVVKSSAAASVYIETSLTLDVTGYFSLYSRNTSNVYSVAVSTSLVLDLPPMAPAGLSGALSSGGTSFLLNWAAIASNLDGSGFSQPSSPSAWELNRYDVYRATGIASANWVWIGSAPVSAGHFSADVPVPGGVFYYRVVSRDAFLSDLADSAMAIDTSGNLWAVHPDRITRLEIPASMAGIVLAGGNSYGRPLLVRASDRPQDLAGRVVKSALFSPVVAPANSPVLLPTAGAGYAVTLHYETAGGLIVPGSAGAAAANDPGNLSAYYVDGPNAAQIFGRVDAAAQEVSVQSGLIGNYQVRTVLRNQAFNFDVSGVSNRALTPNGDGLNDTVVFTFDNPKDSGVSGRVYDVRGRFVSGMAPGPVAGASLMWDGKAGGGVVPRGVYIYQIQAEGRTFNGTVMVIR